MPAGTIAATPNAFRELYEQRYAFVWSVLRRLGVPERDVEDLLQDVFVIVHRRLGDFEERSAKSTWLYAIAVRVYWNYARRQQRRIPLATESANAMPILDDSVGPERFAEQKEASAMLEELLGSLDHDKRTAYVLAEIEGLSAPEIAAVTGANTRTVYSRLRVAKQLVAASAQRVIARERNDVSVRALARRSTARPPAGLRRRAWAALLVRMPGLAATSGSVAGVLSWKLAALVLGLAGVGVVGGSQLQVDEPRVATGGAAFAVTVPSAPSPPVSHHPPTVAAAAVIEPPTAEPPARTAKPERTPPAEDHGIVLLQRARRAIKNSDAREALKPLDQHRQRHPDSPLSRERERTRLAALCALGQNDDAKAFAVAHQLPPACD